MSIHSQESDRKAETHRILNLLARGIHPIDGNALSGEECWNHPVVIRALLFAGDCLLDDLVPLRAVSESGGSKDSPARAGEAWSQSEDSELRTGFERQETLQQLSNRHKRSRGAIVARIVHLDLASDRDEARKIFSSRSCSAETNNDG